MIIKPVSGVVFRVIVFRVVGAEADLTEKGHKYQNVMILTDFLCYLKLQVYLWYLKLLHIEQEAELLVNRLVLQETNI